MILFVLSVLFFLFICDNNDNIVVDSKNKIHVTYNKNKTISFDDFSKGFKENRVITVENKSNKNITYDIRWYKVTNILKKQNDFLYEMECSGKECKTLGISQIPVVDAPVLEEIKIRPKQKQVFTIKFTYKGSEKDAKFTGELRPVENKSND